MPRAAIRAPTRPAGEVGVMLEDQNAQAAFRGCSSVDPWPGIRISGPAWHDSPTIADAARELEEEFALFDDWRDKVEYMIELGKGLPPLPEALKTEGNKVRGCQSQVWLVAEPRGRTAGSICAPTATPSWSRG